MDLEITIKLILAEVKYSDDMHTLEKHEEAKNVYTGPGRQASKQANGGWLECGRQD